MSENNKVSQKWQNVGMTVCKLTDGKSKLIENSDGCERNRRSKSVPLYVGVYEEGDANTGDGAEGIDCKEIAWLSVSSDFVLITYRTRRKLPECSCSSAASILHLLHPLFAFRTALPKP